MRDPALANRLQSFTVIVKLQVKSAGYMQVDILLQRIILIKAEHQIGIHALATGRACWHHYVHYDTTMCNTEH